MESNSATQSEEQQQRNWLELPAEISSMILLKLDTVEILNSARNVCSSWRKICEDPSLWRVINTKDFISLVDLDSVIETFENLFKQAVDLSCGQLVDINIQYYGTDELLRYITRSNQLRRLRIVACHRVSNEGFIEAVSELPLLENLDILFCHFNVETLKTVGNCCPLLTSLKFTVETDKDALAIAETMPKLRHLHICGSLTNKCLEAILDNCSDLETLDLRQCSNFHMNGQLGQKCARIKVLYLPDFGSEDDDDDDDGSLEDDELFVDYDSDPDSWMYQW